MRTKRLVIQAGLLVVAGGLIFAPPASATAPPPHLEVSPSSAASGKALEFTASCYGTPGELTSPGLAAAVTLTGNSSAFVGHGVAGTRIGHFKASFSCTGGTGLPAAGGTATVEFEVVCPADQKCVTPSSAEPTSTPAKPEPTKGPQVKVKPQGAPQTGGGGMAPANFYHGG